MLQANQAGQEGSSHATPVQDAPDRHLDDIIRGRRLHALFQPIVELAGAEIHGYEGLIRGPDGTPFGGPLALFEAARVHGRTVEIEHLCREVVLSTFAEHGMAHKLFLNVSPEALVQPNMRNGATLRYLQQLGLDCRDVVIELTESTPDCNYDLLREATEHYRGMGFSIALDDLGEGFSGLRKWSELRPDYVKVDKHFIRGIDRDAVKLQFVQSIQQIAENVGCRVIAEGIESATELAVVRDLKIAYGQGYFLGRPQRLPQARLSAEAAVALGSLRVSVFPVLLGLHRRQDTVSKLLKPVTPVLPDTSNEAVFAIFEADPNLYSLPVVQGDVPVGLISRYAMVDGFARPYRRELYGRRACELFMDRRPLVVDHAMSLHALSDLITNIEPHHLSNGFIITDHGRYLGVGSGHDLLREITQMQIDSARHANPLTQLPGNVPINEHIDRLLQHGARFWACYVDVDNFKPYNDVYGFRRGDDLIRCLGRLLREAVATEIDFVGHVGGDDFVMLLQSEDWEARCRAILDGFAGAVGSFYRAEDLLRGGIEAEDRRGCRVVHELATLSIGVVQVEPDMFHSHHEVAAAMTVAKKQAKKMPGNTVFLERRQFKVPEVRDDHAGCRVAISGSEQGAQNAA